ncbi:Hypothetical predicted protein [Pelobates cultripes]|uniref:Uncharacterized protein n=1 Tax=Pelobates cultripes TaxID=61616 RepID=A0AAD1VKX7_PELCU|nr:Hypothetical predicted protein [Pelobates cultripes]
MSQRGKNKTLRTEKASFFLARAPPGKGRPYPRWRRAPLGRNHILPSTFPELTLMATGMRTLMAELSDKLQASITAQIHTLTMDLRKELLEIGSRTAHVEKSLDDFAVAHNSLADKLQELETSLEAQKRKVADQEDRSRRNNLRFRGILESVQNTELNKYLTDLFQELTPSMHPDLLVINRAHRLCRPNHLPTTTARDVIARIHFYHVKELITKACRNAALPEPYISASKSLRIYLPPCCNSEKRWPELLPPSNPTT